VDRKRTSCIQHHHPESRCRRVLQRASRALYRRPRPTPLLTLPLSTLSGTSSTHRLLNFLTSALTENEESIIDTFVQRIMETLGFDDDDEFDLSVYYVRRRVPLTTCGNKRAASVDVCLLREDTRIFLVIQEDKTMVSRHNPEPQVIAEAIATLQCKGWDSWEPLCLCNPTIRPLLHENRRLGRLIFAAKAGPTTLQSLCFRYAWAPPYLRAFHPSLVADSSDSSFPHLLSLIGRNLAKLRYWEERSEARALGPENGRMHQPGSTGRFFQSSVFSAPLLTPFSPTTPRRPVSH